MSARTISADQLRRIGSKRGVLSKRVPGFNEIYREQLREMYGVESTKLLTSEQAEVLEAALDARLHPHRSCTGVSDVRLTIRGHGTSVRGRLKFSELGDRPGWLASPKQLRMIDAMWAEVSRVPAGTERDSALDSFVKRITGVDKLVWLPKHKVPAVLVAIRAMQQQPRGAVRPQGAVTQASTQSTDYAENTTNPTTGANASGVATDAGGVSEDAQRRSDHSAGG